jgi:hypothetical protein
VALLEGKPQLNHLEMAHFKSKGYEWGRGLLQKAMKMNPNPPEQACALQVFFETVGPRN